MRLKEFLGRHLMVAGLVAVAVPLAILLGLQYSALARLQETSPAASRASQQTRLAEVARAVDESYLADARHRLDVPASAIRFDQEKDDVSGFAGAPATGVKRYFLASLRGKSRAVITTYDPATGCVDYDSESPEAWAIFSAAVHSLNQMMEPTVVDPSRLEIDTKDPNNRIAIKPIVDADSHIVGAAGLLVDTKFFESEVLPALAEQAAAQHFSQNELAESTFAVSDETGAIRYRSCDAECGAPDVTVPLGFVFSNWTMGIVAHGPGQAALARRYFLLNFTLSTAMTLILIGAVLLSLRAASREMRLSEMKGDFVSNVSHELRTPIASIRVFGELMKIGKVTDPERVREYGGLIEHESRRLTQLVNNILDFSKIESGSKTYKFAPVDVVALVSDAVSAVQPQTSQAGFEVVCERRCPASVFVSADADALSQALLNLLDNAIKYSGDSRSISVQVAEEDGFVQLSVTDSGIGIPPEEHERIFHRFHRVSSSLVHDIKGSGLGLALVRHIVEAHGGSVSVRSRPGAGSTFTIRLKSLPAEQPSSDARPVVAERLTT
ncbi:MAG TPA: HAMP domain-containing sensor histidine kinase [Blastocatellia bacterium]|nr:HAMP domain-containing sensor histidine kinase [Blastocatellia bacterium]